MLIGTQLSPRRKRRYQTADDGILIPRAGSQSAPIKPPAKDRIPRSFQRARFDLGWGPDSICLHTLRIFYAAVVRLVRLQYLVARIGAPEQRVRDHPGPDSAYWSVLWANMQRLLSVIFWCETRLRRVIYGSTPGSRRAPGTSTTVVGGLQVGRPSPQAR